MTDGRTGTLRAVVITGASSGIGKECAFRLHHRGFRVFAGIRREKDRDVVLEGSAGAISPLFLDVTNEGSVAAAAEQVAGAVKDAGLAGLVNNAGIVVGGHLQADRGTPWRGDHCCQHPWRGFHLYRNLTDRSNDRRE